MDFKQQYYNEIVPALKKELNIKNSLAIPKITKIVVNVGFGSILNKTNEKKTDRFEKSLAKITGQKPIVRKAKKSISNFKLRQGMPIGASATLRGQRMYDFWARFIAVAIPRIRDFRGFSKKGDGQGNLSLGIKEHTIFPEVGEQDVIKIHSLGITIATTAKNDNEMFLLLKKFNFPFKKK